MKIVLSIAPCFFTSGSNWTPPIGVLYPAAALDRNRFQVEVLDPVVEGLTTSSLVERIIKARPQVVGLSVMSDTYFAAAQIFRGIKQKNPGIMTVAGGPHPTLLSQAMLHNLPQLDILVRGEGEFAFKRILERIQEGRSLAGIPNTSWRQDGRVIHNPETHRIENLDDIPFPAYDLIDYDKYDLTYSTADLGRLRGINIVSSRGCPFNCSFCSNTNIWGHKVRMRSLNPELPRILIPNPLTCHF
ncbi:MAG: cobalamin-dependent protein [Deltaproteobacteria bacterium]|nr:cobalamin-dependent protein [Deltaproteobacteria bacterium]